MIKPARTEYYVETVLLELPTNGHVESTTTVENIRALEINVKQHRGVEHFIAVYNSLDDHYLVLQQVLTDKTRGGERVKAWRLVDILIDTTEHDLKNFVMKWCIDQET